MVALARRATEGGSWLVRASLATAERWIVDRGVLPRSAYADVPAGRICYLAPIVRMSETPTFWARPPVPLGHNAAAWP